VADVRRTKQIVAVLFLLAVRTIDITGVAQHEPEDSWHRPQMTSLEEKFGASEAEIRVDNFVFAVRGGRVHAVPILL
jgi:hypothetical protein